MSLAISDELRAKLISRRTDQLKRLEDGLTYDPYGVARFSLSIQQEVAGIHLCGTIGFDLYLTFDGRILLWRDPGWTKTIEPIRETQNLGLTALGLASYGLFENLPELLDLLPQRPADQPICWCCLGTRVFEYPNGAPRIQACGICHGLGWGEPNLDVNE